MNVCANMCVKIQEFDKPYDHDYIYVAKSENKWTVNIL